MCTLTRYLCSSVRETCSRRCLCACSAEDRSCESTGAGRARTETGTLWYTGDSGRSGAPGENGCARGRAPASGRSESTPSPHTCTPAWGLFTYTRITEVTVEDLRRNRRSASWTGCVCVTVILAHLCVGSCGIWAESSCWILRCRTGTGTSCRSGWSVCFGLVWIRRPQTGALLRSDPGSLGNKKRTVKERQPSMFPLANVLIYCKLECSDKPERNTLPCSSCLSACWAVFSWTGFTVMGSLDTVLCTPAGHTLCVCMCFFTLDFWAKARPHTMHWKGFSPVWLQIKKNQTPKQYT